MQLIKMLQPTSLYRRCLEKQKQTIFCLKYKPRNKRHLKLCRSLTLESKTQGAYIRKTKT